MSLLLLYTKLNDTMTSKKNVKIIILSCLFFLFTLTIIKAQIQIVRGGHSHNDYYQNRPLLDALDNGMVSIEVDIFLRDGRLLVGHDEKELDDSRTLSNLYLDPLYEQIKLLKGEFLPIILMIDIKDKGKETYKELKEVLKPFHKILTRCKRGKISKRPVLLIISGERPISLLRMEKKRYVFVDGRISDLENEELSNLFPLISDDWNKYFTWNGQGKISSEEYKKLKEIILKCRKQNKLLRFWGIPHEMSKSVKYWDLFQKVGVDLIGCDNPFSMKEYFSKK